MLFFGKKKKRELPEQSYDHEKLLPVLRCSICSGEQVAGFQDKETSAFTEVMLIRNDEDLEAFRSRYGISGEIKKIY